MAVHMHHITEHTQQPLASTWLGDHQGRPSAPLYPVKDFTALYKFVYITLHYITNQFIKYFKLNKSRLLCLYAS